MRNHYVPQFLMRPWAERSSDGKIEVFRLDLQHVPSSRLTPKHTGYEEDLYAFTKPVVAGVDRHAIERQFLRHVDNLGAQVLRKLDGDGLYALAPQNRVDWARFLMSLRLRQPGVIQMLRRESADHLRVAFATQPEQYEELMGPEDPATLEEWADKHFPGLIENFGLSIFHRLVDNWSIGGKILRMRWWLWDFSNVQYDLLLADHPCIFTSGIDDPNLIIAVPIGPQKAFMSTQSDRAADLLRQQRPKDLVMRINESLIAQARSRVYARNQGPARFIRNRWHRLQSSTNPSGHRFI